MAKEETGSGGFTPLTREERRLFSDYLYDSPKNMIAGAVLGGTLAALLFSFWLAFTRLHVYGYWGSLKEDLMFLDILALLFGICGAVLVGRRDTQVAAFWAVCAFMCEAFALASGVFGLPNLPQAFEFFAEFHVGPVFVYGFIAMLSYGVANARIMWWWLLAFLPAATLAPLFLVITRPAESSVSLSGIAIAALLWGAAFLAYVLFFRRRRIAPGDAPYRRRLRSGSAVIHETGAGGR